MLTYVYRITKYDPADRDTQGRYSGPEDTVSDHGEVEAAYLRAVAAFAADTGIDHLAVREPQVPSLAHFGAGPAMDGFGLEALFPSGLAGFHDGAQVPLHSALELVRVMLRDNGAWCRLEAEGRFAVHVGWDQYLYISSSRVCEEALAVTRELGLFAERTDSSPYAFEAEEQEQYIQRPADDDFWADLHRAVVAGQAGILEETYLEGASRWHHLTGDTLDLVRAGLTPRARIAVWPPLSSDIAAVLRAVPADGLVEGVWQDEEGVICSTIADEDTFPELTARMSRARAAALLSVYVGERVPLSAAVMTDDDGVLRARWRTEPTPSDHDGARRRP
ncbi:RNA-binding protein [Streptomyces sp. NPDC029044]|uniref:RNA-binding protein n=1 Tax=Streptomyces sp. NPDC029044 TaxID=3157198 RepID=UPI0033D3B646